MRKSVYLAHPYGRRRGLSEAEIEANAIKSIEIERELMLKNWNVFNPLLWHFVHKDWPLSPDETVWGDLAMAWVDKCDALFYASSSEGTDREYYRARHLGKQIFFELDDVPTLEEK